MPVNLETLQIQFEIKDATGKKIKDLQKKLNELENPEIQVDTSEAERAIDELRDEAERTALETTVSADTTEARRAIRNLEGVADDVDAGEVDINASVRGVEEAIQDVTGAADGVDGGDVSIGGDDTGFGDAVEGVTGAADGVDGGDANIGGDDTGFSDAIADVTGAADGVDGGDANIGGNATGFETVVSGVNRTVQNLPDGNVDIMANPADADSDIEGIETRLRGIESPEIEPRVDLTEAESGFDKLRKLMLGAGLVEFGKSALEFSYNVVNEANAANSINNRIENLGGDYAAKRISEFTREMNKLYGFNESGLAGMTTDFVGIFKGTGMPLEDALDKGIEMTKYAIDYASALDKTPGEIAEIFMSVMKGNTETADSAAIYGLTADAIDARIDEMLGINKATGAQLEELQKEKEQNLALYKSLAFFDIMKENADETMGFTGDWARTANEFGNQMTIIEDKWKTLRESIGQFLLPVATEIAGAVSSILTAVQSVFSTGGDTFVDRLEGYFGTAEMTEEERNALVNSVVGPVSAINEALKTATEELNQNIANHEMAASNLMTMLQRYYYGAGAPGEEEANAAFQSYFDTGMATIAQGEDSLVAMFTSFVGTEDEWNTALQTAINGIETYYKGIRQEFVTQSAELKKLIDESIADQIIDAEELAEIRRAQVNASGELVKAVMIDNQAAAQMRVDEFQKKGDYSARSIKKLNDDLMESVDTNKEALLTEYGKMKEAIYKVAAYNQDWYARDAEGYLKASGGVKPLTAQEMLVETDAMVEQMLAQMEADAANMTARTLHSGIYGRASDLITGYEYEPSGYNQSDAAYLEKAISKDIGSMMYEMRDYVKSFKDIKSRGGVLGKEAEDLIAMYDLFDTHGNLLSVDGLLRWSMDTNTATVEDFLRKAMEVFGADYQFPSVTPADVSGLPAGGGEMADYLGFANFSMLNELVQSVNQFPDTITVESHVYVDGYELGKATEEAIITYDKSTGQ